MEIHKEKVSGIFFILIGLFFAVKSLDYGIGNLTNISAGFFPFWISLLTILLGVIIFALGFKKDKKNLINLKIPLYIFSLLIGFVFIFKYTGLLIAGIFLIWSSAIIHNNFSFKGTLIISVIYSLIIILLKTFILNSLPL